MPKATKFFKIAIPKISFKDTPINVYLVYTLVIFAFLLGMLTNKVMYLEKMANNPTQVAAGPQDTGPTPPPFVEGLSAGKLPLLGNNDAKVTIVEFSDFQCPFCKSYFTDSHQQLVDEYVTTGKVKFAYRHYPLTQIHPNAQKAAEAAECANEQGKFWEFHDVLFEKQDEWANLSADDAAAQWTTYAGELGVDTTQFTSCFENEQYKQNVDDDTADGNGAQVNATPSFFINGVRVVGAVPYDQLKQTIEEELNK